MQKTKFHKERGMTMKHRHYDMICAKAGNMDLVVFAKASTGWRKFTGDFPDFGLDEYFLCLPQHKEACLHWLNGGVCQIMIEDNLLAMAVSKHELGDWSRGLIWMGNQDIRIKPRKEKRWIGVKKGECTPRNFETRDDAVFWINSNAQSSSDYWQLIEIEIEI